LIKQVIDKKVIIYNTPEEAEEAEIQELRKLTNQEKLDRFCLFMMSIYGEDINTPRRLGGLVEAIDFPEG
jgi:hypothetical protein